MKKIVIASDSFKGSLSSIEVAHAVSEAVCTVHPECKTICINMADGGEGSMEALCSLLEAEKMTARVEDPYGRSIEAGYCISCSDEGKTAIIDIASASGLTLRPENERNPLIASSIGTGELILDAYRNGCRKFIICLGGSAVNDAGTGLLQALGFRFMDTDGISIGRCCGKTLSDIASFVYDGSIFDLAETEFILACDVDAVFSGPTGATRVFGPQKGADKEMIEILEGGMQSFAEIICQKTGKDVNAIKGSGAAGGTAGTLAAISGGRICSGADLILDAIGFDSIIQDADLIITGEGKMDMQSLTGKAPFKVLQRGMKAGIKVISIAGIVELDDKAIRDSGFEEVLAIQSKPESMEALRNAMKAENTKENIKRTIREYLLKTV